MGTVLSCSAPFQEALPAITQQAATNSIDIIGTANRPVHTEMFHLTHASATISWRGAVILWRITW